MGIRKGLGGNYLLTPNNPIHRYMEQDDTIMLDELDEVDQLGSPASPPWNRSTSPSDSCLNSPASESSPMYAEGFKTPEGEMSRPAQIGYESSEGSPRYMVYESPPRSPEQAERPCMAPAIGHLRRAPPRQFSEAARGTRLFCAVLGAKLAERFEKEPELAEQHRYTVAMDPASVQGGLGKATNKLAQVTIVSLPDFAVRYEALVTIDPSQIKWRSFKKADGTWSSGYLTHSTDCTGGT